MYCLIVLPPSLQNNISIFYSYSCILNFYFLQLESSECAFSSYWSNVMFLSEYPLFIPNSARYYIPIENTLLRNWFKSWEALSIVFLPTDLQKHQQPTETLAQGPVYTVTGSSVLFRRKKFVFPYVKWSRPVVLTLLGIFFYNPQLPITASQDLSFCKCIIFSYCGICGTVNTIMAFQPQVLGLKQQDSNIFMFFFSGNF